MLFTHGTSETSLHELVLYIVSCGPIVVCSVEDTTDSIDVSSVNLGKVDTSLSVDRIVEESVVAVVGLAVVSVIVVTPVVSTDVLSLVDSSIVTLAVARVVSIVAG